MGAMAVMWLHQQRRWTTNERASERLGARNRLTSAGGSAECAPMSNATHNALIGNPTGGGEAPRRPYFRYWFST